MMGFLISYMNHNCCYHFQFAFLNLSVAETVKNCTVTDRAKNVKVNSFISIKRSKSLPKFAYDMIVANYTIDLYIFRIQMESV